MGILIEATTGETTRQEWEALAAFVNVMRGMKTEASPIAPEEPTGPEVTLVAMGDPVVTEVPDDAPCDSRGVPWDARIHASTKTTKADGTWTSRRGAAPELIAAVEAELIAAAEAELKPALGTDLTSPAMTADIVPDAKTAPPPPTGTPAIRAESSPATAPPPPSEPPAGETPFTSLMRQVVTRQQAGTVTTAMVNEIAVSLGLTSVRDLNSRHDLIPAFMALLP